MKKEQLSILISNIGKLGDEYMRKSRTSRMFRIIHHSQLLALSLQALRVAKITDTKDLLQNLSLHTFNDDMMSRFKLSSLAYKVVKLLAKNIPTFNESYQKMLKQHDQLPDKYLLNQDLSMLVEKVLDHVKKNDKRVSVSADRASSTTAFADAATARAGAGAGAGAEPVRSSSTLSL